MPTIKAKIGGVWTTVVGGGAEEVFVGPGTPADPNVELWYDTDEPNLVDTDTARWNSAWGVVGQAVQTAALNNVGATMTDIPGLAVTFTPVVGRRYKTTLSFMAQQSGASGSVTVPAITDAANIVKQQRNVTVAPSNYYHGYAQVIETFATTAATTRKGRMLTTNGDTSMLVDAALFPNFIAVEDVGPVSLASNPPAAPPSVWTAPTFQNGWVNYSPPGVQVAQYRLVGDKVELRGAIKSGAMGTVAFTLPVGYRPPATIYWGILTGGPTYGYMTIGADGNVVPQSGNAGQVMLDFSFSVLS